MLLRIPHPCVNGASCNRKRRSPCKPGLVKLHELGLIIPDFAELPSGMLVPVDVRAQSAPPSLPPGIDRAPRARPVFIQRQPAVPIDYIHSWIDETQLGFSMTQLPDLIEAIKLLPFEKTFRALAWLLRKLTIIARDTGAQLILAERVYAQLPRVRQRMREAVAQHPSHLPFAEPVLIPLLRLFIEHADTGDADFSEAETEVLLERIILAAPSAIGDRSEEVVSVGDTSGWLAFFMRKSNYLRDRATLNGLVRQHELFRLMAGPLDERAEAERCDVKGAMNAAYGLTVDEQLRLGFALAAHLRVWDDSDGEVNLMRFSPKAFAQFVNSLNLSDRLDEVIRLVSRTRDEFRREFERLDPDHSLLTSTYVPFQQTPFLRCPDGSMVLSSPRFLSDWLEDGFHYRALDAIAGHPRDKCKSGKYLRFSGHVFERYCVDLARQVHRVAFAGHVNVRGDFAFRTSSGESRTVDLMVFSGSDLVLFEIEHHRPGVAVTVQGDPAAAEQDLREHLVPMIHDIAEFTELLRSPKAPRIEDLDMKHIRRIFPVVVSLEAPAQQPVLWDFLDREAVPRLREASLEPLTILDAEEFEMLCGLVEGGTLLPSLLERKSAPAYARLDLKVWLDDDPLAPTPRRPRQLEEAYEHLVDRVAAAIQFSPAHGGDSGPIQP